MKPRTPRLIAVSAMVGMLGLTLASAAVDPLSRRDAARLQAKIDKINKNIGTRGTPAPLRTAVTEAEVNSYLRYELSDRIPPGVKDPWVTILGDRRLAGRATVDLSEVGKSRKTSGGVLDPYSYLTGSMPLTANGVLTTKDGVASFALESAAISGVPVPVWMLQDIVTYYSKSSAAPQGVAIDKPFALPAGIREIQLDRGQAVIVQ